MAVKLIVGTADELMEILDRRRRQLIGVGQGQVGAGRAIQIGEAGDIGGRRNLATRLSMTPQSRSQFLPMPPPRFQTFQDSHAYTCRFPETERAASAFSAVPRNGLLIQTAQEQNRGRFRRQVELRGTTALPRVPADFLPPAAARKRLAALHIKGKGQPQRPVHLKARRDRPAISATRSSRNFSTPARARRLVHNDHGARGHVAQPLETVAERRGNEPHDEKRQSQFGKPQKTGISGTTGMASTTRSTFRSTACQARIGWPWIVTTRMRRARLPGVWPFHTASSRPP